MKGGELKWLTEKEKVAIRGTGAGIVQIGPHQITMKKTQNLLLASCVINARQKNVAVIVVNKEDCVTAH